MLTRSNTIMGIFTWLGFDKKPDPSVQPVTEKETVSWFSRLKNGLRFTQNLFANPLKKFLNRGTVLSESEQIELKKTLLQSDLGPKLSKELIDFVNQNYTSENSIEKLKKILLSYCVAPDSDFFLSTEVILMIGVNGAGKTTTIAKLAHQFSNKRPILIAADTFRAAAVEQLKEWGIRVQTPIYASEAQDPAAVVYQGLEYAQVNNHDLVLIDTSGRLHSNKNLMQELSKVKKIIYKKISPIALKTILVLDGSQGQNMLDQVKIFSQDIGIDGLIVTKLDGSSKAGALFEVMREFKIPLCYIGCGEQISDLQNFNPEEFVEALLEA